MRGRRRGQDPAAREGAGASPGVATSERARRAAPAHPASDLQDALGNRGTLALMRTARRHEADADRFAAATAPALGSLELPRPGAAGVSIPAPARAVLARGLGRDLDAVRIHADAPAAALTDGLDAQAATRGADIYLGRDIPRAAWPKLLAHETAHVAQQAHGAASGFQRRPRSGRKTGTIKIKWIDDSVEIYHRIVDKVAAKFRVDEAMLWVSFSGPAQRIFNQLESSTKKGRKVSLDVSFYYDAEEDTAGDVTVSVHADAAAVAKAKTAEEEPAELPPEKDPDLNPPADETEEQREARNRRLTLRHVADMVESADREGYDAIFHVIENNGRETSVAKMEKVGERKKRKSGVSVIKKDRVKKSVGGFLDLLSERKNWRVTFWYKRDKDGGFVFYSMKTDDITQKPVSKYSEEAELRALGIPDRAEIYQKIFEEAEKELKDSAIQIASFGIEQVVLWIVGGALLKGLGFALKGAGRFLPRLSLALRGGEEAAIGRAMAKLPAAEQEELGLLLEAADTNAAISATEEARMGELLDGVEQELAAEAKASTGSFTPAATTGLRSSEIKTGERLADELGIAIKESEHAGADYVDDLGRAYDAVGGGANAAAHWDEAVFLDSLKRHFLKSDVFVVIDLTEYSAAQQAAVQTYLDGLSTASKARIIKIGF